MTDALLFHRIDLTPEAFAGEVARVLRSGSASEAFLRALADLFDPPRRPRSQPHPFAVKVQRIQKNRPRKPHNRELGQDMIEAMKAKGADEKSEAVAARIAAMHHVSKRTAYAAMKREQEFDMTREQEVEDDLAWMVRTGQW